MGDISIWSKRLLAAAALVASAAHCGSPQRSEPERTRLRERAETLVRSETHEALERFEDEAALHAYLARLREAERLRQQAMPPAPAYAQAEAAEAPTEASTDASGDDGDESITNNQVAGVDEGGIVKVHGDHLVVLRRGRLFTVRIGDRSLTPVARIDAYPAGAPGGWYDEMLVHDDTIVVVGFNHSAGGTELGLFDIDDAGQLSRRGTFYLRSNDYYSSRNYASRLLGDRLVFYMPYMLGRGGEVSLPAVRARGRDDWDEVITASHIYRPIQDASHPVLHTVVTCDLSQPGLQCTAQGVLGPWGRSFYVSRDAVYVWLGGERHDDRELPPGAVYRLPFDGSALGATRVSGMPVDQFSFQERDGHLNVVVRSHGHGDWMWAPEATAGEVAMAHLPLALFSDGVTTAPAESYRRLPRLEGWAFQNRFVHDHLFYGTGQGWGAGHEAHGQVVVHDTRSGSTSVLALPHGVDRLDRLGRDGVVIGAGGGDLHFTTVALDGAAPRVASRYVQEGASQGETRSHGFFYRPEDERGGMLGLPIRGGRAGGWRQLVEGSAGVLYLRVRDRQLSPVGVLASRGETVNDRCQASCVDWYGNARPIFLRGRVFALLGYELVEGSVEGASMREVRRTNLFSGT